MQFFFILIFCLFTTLLTLNQRVDIEFFFQTIIQKKVSQLYVRNYNQKFPESRNSTYISTIEFVFQYFRTFIKSRHILTPLPFKGQEGSNFGFSEINLKKKKAFTKKLLKLKLYSTKIHRFLLL